jgi:MFS family permease
VRRRRSSAGGLLQHHDFRLLWTGQSISEFGSQISQVAIPLVAAVSLHASPLQFSLLTVVGFMPFILFALPAGAWVDRLRRRPILIVGDSSRAVLLALVPVLWATHTLRIWELLAIQFVVGVFTVLFDVAYQSYLPALVAREHLVEGNSKLQLTASMAQVAGPGASGALVGALTAPYAVAADAISYVISTGFLIRMRHDEPAPDRETEAPPHVWSEAKEGLAWVLGNRWLRAIATCTGTSNFFSNVVFSIFLLYLVRSLHMPSVEIGAVLAAGSTGAIIAALTVKRINARIGVGPTIVGAIALGGMAQFAFPLAPRSAPVPVLIAGLIGDTFGAVAYNVTQVSLRQAITPQRLQGRMNAGMRWIVWGTIPLGSLAGGFLAQSYGLHLTLWIGAVGGLAPVLPVALTQIRSVRTIPEPVEETVSPTIG